MRVAVDAAEVDGAAARQRRPAPGRRRARGRSARGARPGRPPPGSRRAAARRRCSGRRRRRRASSPRPARAPGRRGQRAEVERARRCPAPAAPRRPGRWAAARRRRRRGSARRSGSTHSARMPARSDSSQPASRRRWRPPPGRGRSRRAPRRRCASARRPGRGCATFVPTAGAGRNTRAASSKAASSGAIRLHTPAITGVTSKPFAAASMASARHRPRLQRAVPLQQRLPACDGTRHGHALRTGEGHLVAQRVGIGRRRSPAAGVEAGRLAVLPDEREGIAADADRHRFDDAEDGGGADRGVGGVAARLQAAQGGESTASGWLVAAIPEREIVSVEGTRPGYGIGDAY